MAGLIVLDTSPLWLACKARGHVDGDRCRAWLAAIALGGARVVAPEVADYEVRRELLRVRATAAVGRLDRLLGALEFDPLSTPAMRRAAEYWATVRQAGLPTADPLSLDADCILAAQASLVGGPGDVVTIATTNVGHLERFPGIVAREWWTIA